jgi:hypothetical protein
MGGSRLRLGILGGVWVQWIPSSRSCGKTIMDFAGQEMLASIVCGPIVNPHPGILAFSRDELASGTPGILGG